MHALSELAALLASNGEKGKGIYFLPGGGNENTELLCFSTIISVTVLGYLPRDAFPFVDVTLAQPHQLKRH